MTDSQQVKLSITLVPPGLYDPKDPEWQEICKNLFSELRVSLDRENLDVTLEPKKEEHPKAGEWLELFNTIIVSFGGTAALLATLRYLFEKLIELQKDRRETERAREIEVTVGEKSLKFKGMGTKEITEIMQKIEEVYPHTLSKPAKKKS